MPAFIAQQVTRSHIIHLPATPHKIFLLFSPLGEKHWAQGWKPEMLYPSSGIAQTGTVFTTRHANKPTQIWTIIAYAQEQTQVSYTLKGHNLRVEASEKPASRESPKQGGDGQWFQINR
jgi:hypothetical protein